MRRRRKADRSSSTPFCASYPCPPRLGSWSASRLVGLRRGCAECSVQYVSQFQDRANYALKLTGAANYCAILLLQPRPQLNADSLYRHAVTIPDSPCTEGARRVEFHKPIGFSAGTSGCGSERGPRARVPHLAPGFRLAPRGSHPANASVVRLRRVGVSFCRLVGLADFLAGPVG